MKQGNLEMAETVEGIANQRMTKEVTAPDTAHVPENATENRGTATGEIVIEGVREIKKDEDQKTEDVQEKTTDIVQEIVIGREEIDLGSVTAGALEIRSRKMTGNIV